MHVNSLSNKLAAMKQTKEKFLLIIMRRTAMARDHLKHAVDPFFISKQCLQLSH